MKLNGQPAFPSLSAQSKKALAAKGIDAEESYRQFQLEIRVGNISETLINTLALHVPDDYDTGPDEYEAPQTQNGHCLLSAREQQILMACALGRSHEEVAEFYGIQKTTVNKHLDRMKKRLGIPNCPSSTTLLVAECWRKGYLTTRL